MFHSNENSKIYDLASLTAYILCSYHNSEEGAIGPIAAYYDHRFENEFGHGGKTAWTK